MRLSPRWHQGPDVIEVSGLFLGQPHHDSVASFAFVGIGGATHIVGRNGSGLLQLALTKMVNSIFKKIG